MTATAPVHERRAGTPAAPRDTSSATRRTMLALGACALGVIPLKGLFVDYGWLLDAWLSMAVVIAPAALLRLRRPPGALDVWPGIVLLVLWLTARFVPSHALLGIIPTGGTIHDLGNLMDQLHQTTRDGVAPIHTTVAVRLVVAALVGLLAALVDLVAVVGRRGALAAVPLLVIFTISGAVPRHAVAWQWFVLGAAGFLILLALDATDERQRWGRRVSRARSTERQLASQFTAQRVGVAAIVLALIIPVLLPSQSRNLLTDLFHNKGGGGGSGTGGVSPFADLKGELNRTNPVHIADVTVDRTTAQAPFYLRSDVLDLYTATGWRSTGHGSTKAIEEQDYSATPATNLGPSISFNATVTVRSLDGLPPIFAQPRSLHGLSKSDTRFSPRDQVLQGQDVHKGQRYTEEVSQPAPDRATLEQATDAPPADLGHWMQLPKLPAEVTTLVRRITANERSPYDKARAISDYFTDAANGFTYDTKTKLGDSGSELVDFLRNKVGYCQQYAAAMGVMLRAVGIPARVVLGYEHPAPDSHGTFSISSNDAHAWVEAYFTGVGWVPFDPTPIGGLDGGKKTDLAYAPHPYTSADDNAPNKSDQPIASVSPGQKQSSSAAPRATPKKVSTPTDLAPLWVALIVLVVLAALLAPAIARLLRRRRRYRAGREGDTEALWAELSDTATDLGYVWSPSRSPRQVADWLGGYAERPDALSALALAVERERYDSRSTVSAADGQHLTEDLAAVTDALRGRRSGRSRLQAFLLPASSRIGRTGAISRLRRGRRR